MNIVDAPVPRTSTRTKEETHTAKNKTNKTNTKKYSITKQQLQIQQLLLLLERSSEPIGSNESGLLGLKGFAFVGLIFVEIWIKSLPILGIRACESRTRTETNHC